MTPKRQNKSGRKKIAIEKMLLKSHYECAYSTVLALFDGPYFEGVELNFHTL